MASAVAMAVNADFSSVTYGVVFRGCFGTVAVLIYFLGIAAFTAVLTAVLATVLGAVVTAVHWPLWQQLLQQP